MLYSIASCIGGHIKLDHNTYWTSRGRFARFCVELDLTKPLLREIELNGKLYNVEYENFSSICYKYGRVGHRREECSLNEARQIINQRTQTHVENEVIMSERVINGYNVEGENRFGPWMMASKRVARKSIRQKEGNGNGRPMPRGKGEQPHYTSNKFGTLEAMEEELQLEEVQDEPDLSLVHDNAPNNNDLVKGTKPAHKDKAPRGLHQLCNHVNLSKNQTSKSSKREQASYSGHVKPATKANAFKS